jgi:hypothetical protein
MKQIIKPYFVHILCFVLAAMHIGCSEEILPTNTDALNGNHPGVHLTLLPPTITLDGATATTRTGGTEAPVQIGDFLMQLVDVDGKVLRDKNDKPQQSEYHYGAGVWELQANPTGDDATYSQPITVTGGAGIYRMRVAATITLADEAVSSPITYFDAVNVTDNGDETGSITLNLARNLTAALQVKLVEDNGAELPDGGSYKISYNSPNLPAIGSGRPTFTNITFTDKTVDNLAVLKTAGVIAPYTDYVIYANSGADYLTQRMPCFEPITAAAANAGKEIFTINETDGETVLKSYTVTAPAAGITLAAGHSYLLTVALNGRDATIQSFTIADMEDGGNIDVENNPHIQLVDDTYQIHTAKGMKAFADIVNGATEAYTINGITIPTTANGSANGKLMKNIDLSSVCNATLGDWAPMGVDDNNTFKGNFDGNNKTISNLYIGASTSEYAGLFGVAQGTTLQNITLSNPTVESTDGYSEIGGVVGYVFDGTTIINCHIAEGTISGLNCVGGIVGIVDGAMIGCTATDLTLSGHYVGGIAGAASVSDLIACLVTKTAISGTDVGGIAGVASFSDLTACLVTKTAISGTDVGGIAGTASFSDLTANYFTPSVTLNKETAAGATSNINIPEIVGTLNDAIATYNAAAAAAKQCLFHYEINPDATLPLIAADAPKE